MIIRSLRQDEGFTLSEVLVVTGLVVVITASAYLLMNAASAMSDSLEARTTAIEEGRIVMDQLSREIRQAYEINEGQGAFVTAQARDCVFYTDVDRDGVPEKVRYHVVGDRIYRSQVSATTEMPPYTFGAFGSEQQIEGVLESTWTGSLFVYYDSQDPPVIATQLADISGVSIRLKNSVTVRARSASVDVTTWVKVRAVHNTID